MKFYTVGILDMILRKKTLIIFLVLSLCSIIALLACTINISYAKSVDFRDGEGTLENPYKISTPEELNNVRFHNDAYFKQTANIDMSGYEDFAPIGSSSFPFSGYYDGGNFLISNLNIKGGANTGLFSFLFKATVKNIKLINANISGTINVGGLCGSNNKGTLEGVIVDGKITGDGNVGGIVGINAKKSTIKECGNLAKISKNITSPTGEFFGGISGSNYAEVVDCYNISDINIESGNVHYSGGITGLNNGSDASIRKSYNVGLLGGAAIGQIAGDNRNGYIENCKWLHADLDKAASFNNDLVINSYSLEQNEFSNADFFSDWVDFDSKWMQYEGDYPRLKREYVSASDIEFKDGETLYLRPGDSHAINTDIKPIHSTLKHAKLSISPTTVIENFDNESGLLTIKEDAAIGSTFTVTASADNIQKVLKIVIIKIPVTNVELSHNVSDNIISPRQEIQFNATIYPLNATNKSITYNVSSSYAQITSDGILTISDNAPEGLQFDVIAKSEDNPNISNKIRMTVKAAHIEKIIVTCKDNFKTTESLMLEGVVKPEYAVHSEIQYKIISSTALGAEIRNNYLFATSPGEIVLIAYIGSIFSDEFVVTVNKEAVTDVKFMNDDSFKAGEYLVLNALAYPENATYKKIEYSINGENTIGASIDGNILRAEKPGNVYITATADGLTAIKRINVEKIAVENIVFSVSDEFKHTEYLELKAEVIPFNATYKDIKYQISTSTVEAYISDGKLYANAPGLITIIAQADGFSVEKNIKVLKEPVISVQVQAEYIEYDRGEALQLKANIYPKNATYQQAIFYTNSKHAIIDSNGILYIDNNTPIGTLIEVYAVVDGVQSANYSIYSGKIEVETVELYLDTQSVEVGGCVNTVVKINPEFASNPGITYEIIGDAEIIDGVIYVNNPSAVGSTIYITAVVDGVRSNTESITVAKTPVQDIQLSCANNFKVGDILQLNATVFPFNASNKNVSYSIISAGQTGAKIYDGNILAADNIGELTLRISADGVYRDIVITVLKEPVTEIVLTSAKYVKVYNELNLQAIVYPMNATYREVTFSILEDACNAFIYDNILVAEKPGYVTIRVTADGLYRDYIIEVLKEPVTDIVLTCDTSFKHTNNLILSAMALPLNATYNEIEYSILPNSINARIVDGRIYADKPGNFSLILSSDGVRKEFIITVEKEPVRNIKFANENEIDLSQGYRKASLKLNAIIYPMNATYQDVTYEIVSGENDFCKIVNGTIYFDYTHYTGKADILDVIDIRATADGVSTLFKLDVRKQIVTQILLSTELATRSNRSSGGTLKDWITLFADSNGIIRFRTSQTVKLAVDFNDNATYKEYTMTILDSNIKDLQLEDNILYANSVGSFTLRIKSKYDEMYVDINFVVEKEPVTSSYLGIIVSTDHENSGKFVGEQSHIDLPQSPNYDISNYKFYSEILVSQGVELKFLSYMHGSDTNRLVTTPNNIELLSSENINGSGLVGNNEYLEFSGDLIKIKQSAPVNKSIYLFVKIDGIISNKIKITINTQYIDTINKIVLNSNGQLIANGKPFSNIANIEKVEISITNSKAGIDYNKVITTTNANYNLYLYANSFSGGFDIAYKLHFKEGDHRYSIQLPNVKRFNGLSGSKSNFGADDCIVLLDEYSRTVPSKFNVGSNVKALYIRGNATSTYSTTFNYDNDAVETELYLHNFSFKASTSTHAITVNGEGKLTLKTQGNIRIQAGNGKSGNNGQSYEPKADPESGSIIRNGECGGNGTNGSDGIHGKALSIICNGTLSIEGGHGGEGGKGGHGEGSDNPGVGQAGHGGNGGDGGKGGYGIYVYNLELSGGSITVRAGNGGSGKNGGLGGEGKKDSSHTTDSGGNGGNGGHAGHGGAGLNIMSISLSNTKLTVYTGNAGSAGNGGNGGRSNSVVGNKQPVRGAGGAGGNGGCSGAGIFTGGKINIDFICYIGTATNGGKRGVDGDGDNAVCPNSNKNGGNGAVGVKIYNY